MGKEGIIRFTQSISIGLKGHLKFLLVFLIFLIAVAASIKNQFYHQIFQRHFFLDLDLREWILQILYYSKPEVFNNEAALEYRGYSPFYLWMMSIFYSFTEFNTPAYLKMSAIIGIALKAFFLLSGLFWSIRRNSLPLFIGFCLFVFFPVNRFGLEAFSFANYEIYPHNFAHVLWVASIILYLTHKNNIEKIISFSLTIPTLLMHPNYGAVLLATLSLSEFALERKKSFVLIFITTVLFGLTCVVTGLIEVLPSSIASTQAEAPAFYSHGYQPTLIKEFNNYNRFFVWLILATSFLIFRMKRKSEDKTYFTRLSLLLFAGFSIYLLRVLFSLGDSFQYPSEIMNYLFEHKTLRFCTILIGLVFFEASGKGLSWIFKKGKLGRPSEISFSIWIVFLCVVVLRLEGISTRNNMTPDKSNLHLIIGRDLRADSDSYVMFPPSLNPKYSFALSLYFQRQLFLHPAGIHNVQQNPDQANPQIKNRAQVIFDLYSGSPRKMSHAVNALFQTAGELIIYWKPEKSPLPSWEALMRFPDGGGLYRAKRRALPQ